MSYRDVAPTVPESVVTPEILGNFIGHFPLTLTDPCSFLLKLVMKMSYLSKKQTDFLLFESWTQALNLFETRLRTRNLLEALARALRSHRFYRENSLECVNRFFVMGTHRRSRRGGKPQITCNVVIRNFRKRNFFVGRRYRRRKDQKPWPGVGTSLGFCSRKRA